MRFYFTLIIVFLIGCNSASKNKEIIQGTWKVVSLSKQPLTITNYKDGRLNIASVVNFRDDGIMEIFFSDSTSSPEIFKYEVSGKELAIFYSDYGIPFEIHVISSNKIALKATGYGNTEELRKAIREITLIKND